MEFGQAQCEDGDNMWGRFGELSLGDNKVSSILVLDCPPFVHGA